MILPLSSLFPSGITVSTVLEIIAALIIVWIVVSIPAWIAGKLVTRGKATFREAMAATLFGPVVYIIVLVAVDFLLGNLLGIVGYVIGFILAFIAWVWVYKATFKTGWLGGFAIGVLAIIVFVVALLIIGVILGVSLNLLPTSPLQSV